MNNNEQNNKTVQYFKVLDTNEEVYALLNGKKEELLTAIEQYQTEGFTIHLITKEEHDSLFKELSDRIEKEVIDSMVTVSDLKPFDKRFTVFKMMVEGKESYPPMKYVTEIWEWLNETDDV